jgi:hypothetical protein
VVRHRQRPDGEAQVAVSCGNTGALMAVSMIRLRKLPGVNRPAIACLWPSRNPGGFNVMLDVGADVKAEAEDLLQYATMGASYARNGLGLARPRIGLLNVGTEEHKGRAELKEAHDRMPAIGRYRAASNSSALSKAAIFPRPRRCDRDRRLHRQRRAEDRRRHRQADLRFHARGVRARLLSKFAALLAMNSLEAIAKTHGPAPRQRRGVPRAERHGREIARLGGCTGYRRRSGLPTGWRSPASSNGWPRGLHLPNARGRMPQQKRRQGTGRSGDGPTE